MAEKKVMDTLTDLVTEVNTLRREKQALQAKLDALMLEFCPEDMSEEQMIEWAAHQEYIGESNDRV